MIFALKSNPGSSYITGSEVRRGEINTGLEKLATGKRIVSAADDASGAAIADRMESRINGLERGIQNIQEAVSMFQEADGGVQTVLGILQRLRELALRGSNATLNDADRRALQDETDQMLDQIRDMADDAKYGGKIKLLDGSNPTIVLHDGAEASDYFETSLPADVRLATLGIENLDLTTQTSSGQSMDRLDSAMQILQGYLADIGSEINRMEMILQKGGSEQENTMAANSRLEDANMADVISKLTRDQVMYQAGQYYSVQADMGFRQNLSRLVMQIQ